ncbi:MAG: hypothetical protein ACSHX8_08265 [Opitutaceae bacterium]
MHSRNFNLFYSFSFTLIALCLVALSSRVSAAVFINSASNSEDITQVTYDVNGSNVFQTLSEDTINNNDATSANLMNVSISQAGGGSLTLNEFNSGVVSAVTFASGSSLAGFSAFYGGMVVEGSDTNAFREAVMGIHSNTSLREYVNKDSDADANSLEKDYDISYQYALSNDDFIILAERDGNSQYSLEALDANGNLILSAERLTFESSAYTWDTGYLSSLDPRANQSLELSIVSIGLFDTVETIFGLRVINQDGADGKLFIASDDTFTNNELNPNAVPEVSVSALISGISVGLLVFLRRRR